MPEKAGPGPGGRHPGSPCALCLLPEGGHYSCDVNQARGRRRVRPGVSCQERLKSLSHGFALIKIDTHSSFWHRQPHPGGSPDTSTLAALRGSSQHSAFTLTHLLLLVDLWRLRSWEGACYAFGKEQQQRTGRFRPFPSLSMASLSDQAMGLTNQWGRLAHGCTGGAAMSRSERKCSAFHQNTHMSV